MFYSQSHSFTAALTGLPVLLREEDVRTEYPEDVDDENVTETDFLPTLPGESTRISSALALFGASRVLNKALEYIFPSNGGYEVVVSKMRSVAEQLDTWVKTLPAHLRLEFSQDKPSTNITSSRSPLLVSCLGRRSQRLCSTLTSALLSLWFIIISVLSFIAPLSALVKSTFGHHRFWLHLTRASILFRSYSCLTKGVFVSRSVSTGKSWCSRLVWGFCGKTRDSNAKVNSSRSARSCSPRLLINSNPSRLRQQQSSAR